MSYPKFINFGKAINNQVNDPVNDSNPLTYCLFPTLNAQFVHGSTSANLLYSPYSPNCQSFMVDYCSKNWDGFCEAYNAINIDRVWPNNAAVDVAAQQYANSFQGFYPTAGENLIRNVVHRRFIAFPNLKTTYQPFDPNVANSPVISYTGPYASESSIVINLDTPANIDKDQFVHLMIRNPRPSFDVLARIYLAVQRKDKNVRIGGTIIDDFFRKNSELFERFLQHAVGAITSFQVGRSTFTCNYSSSHSK